MKGHCHDRSDGRHRRALAHYRGLFDLTGKTAVVLGAASGIGKASAEALAALGASVICADKDRAGVERTAAELARHVKAEAHVVDAGSADDITALAAAATERGRVDIAVTTPAMHIRKWFLDYTDDEFDRIVRLNLRGVFLFLRAFGRIMRDQGGGSLIATSSMRATTLEPGLAIYGATKAGALCRSCAGSPPSRHVTFASTRWCRASSRPHWCSR